MQKRQPQWWFVKPTAREEVCRGKAVVGQGSPAAAPTPEQHPGMGALPKPDPMARARPGRLVCKWMGWDALPAGSGRSCAGSAVRNGTEEHCLHRFFPGVLVGLVYHKEIWVYC